MTLEELRGFIKDPESSQHKIDREVALIEQEEGEEVFEIIRGHALSKPRCGNQ